MNRFAIAAALVLTLAACGDKQPPKPTDTSSFTVGDAPSPTFAPTVAASLAPSGAYAPRNTCNLDPQAVIFRSALEDAVARRDAAALAKLAAPGVKLDFGGGGGTADLAARLDKPRGEGGWEDLAELLKLGCVIHDGRMIMPSYFTREFPDPYATMIVVGEKVPFRLRPETGSPPVAMLAWDAVTLPGSLDLNAPFQRVRLEDGGEGFVPTFALRSVLDYRLIAEREGPDKPWRIGAFVAGD